MTRVILLVVSSVSLIPSIALAQAPAVVSTSPSPNDRNVSVSTNVSVTFDVDMDAATIGDASVIVTGSMTGPSPGTIAYDAPSRTATFDPAADFIEGEVVSVVLTESVESSLGDALDGFAWSFTAIAAPAPAEFPGRVTVAAANAPQAVSVADVDGDGHLDLSTANASSGGPSGAPVSVSLNQGDGTFGASELYLVGSTPHPILATDVNGDGHLDLVTGNKDDFDLSVLINDGDGTFAEHVPTLFCSGPSRSLRRISITTAIATSWWAISAADPSPCS